MPDELPENANIVATGRGVFVSLVAVPLRWLKFAFTLGGSEREIDIVVFDDGGFAGTDDAADITVIGNLVSDDEQGEEGDEC